MTSNQPVAGMGLQQIWTALLLPSPDAEPLQVTANRVLTQDYVARINGSVLDRSAAIENIRRARQQASGGTITVLDEMRSQDQMAGRVLFCFPAEDGTDTLLEALMIAQVSADGRLSKLVEMLQPIDEAGGAKRINDGAGPRRRVRH